MAQAPSAIRTCLTWRSIADLADARFGSNQRKTPTMSQRAIRRTLRIGPD